MCTRLGLEARLGYIQVNQASQICARLDLRVRLDGIHTNESSKSNARSWVLEHVWNSFGFVCSS